MSFLELLEFYRLNGFQEFLLAYYTCHSDVHERFIVSDRYLSVLEFQYSKIILGNIERHTVEDAIRIRSYYCRDGSKINTSHESDFVLEGKYVIISTPLTDIETKTGDNQDTALQRVDRIAEMVSLVAGRSTCLERHHYRLYSITNKNVYSYSNIAIFSGGDTIEHKISKLIVEFFHGEYYYNTQKEKIYTIIDLLSRSRDTRDRNVLFLSYWIGLEIATSGSKGRRSLCLDILKSEFLNQKLKFFFDMRNGFVHEGATITFSELDEQILRSSILFALFCSSKNINVAQNIISILEREDDRARNGKSN